MNKRQAWLTAAPAIILVLSLLRAGLPDLSVSASSPQLATATALPTAADTATSAAACDATRSVQVTGSAVVNVVPDRALIQLGVQSNASTTAAVEQMNSMATQAVIKAVRGMGVEGQDIATDVYVIEPVYENYDSLFIKGYRINNVVAITLRDVSKTSVVIGAALRAGANQVLGVDFYTSELRKYRDQARAMAMTAAQEKAQALAATAGTSAGCVLSINENSWSYFSGWGYGHNNQNQLTQNAVQNAAPSAGNSSAADEPISLGKIAVKAEVSASFSLR
jgi:uncharacterized protein YggE